MGEAKFRARRCATPGTNAISSLLKRASLHDHYSAAAASPNSRPIDTTAGPRMVCPPEFLRRDAHVLTAIRSLPRSSNLVLFTPVVPPAPEEDSSFPSPTAGGAVQEDRPGRTSSRADADAPMDPFEPFGRALSRHHSRVRHVPYVPAVGMTTTHHTFLKHAAAAVVVVVVCNSNSPHRSSAHSRFDYAPAFTGLPVQRTMELQHEGPYHSPYLLPPVPRSPGTPAPAPVKAVHDFESSRSAGPDTLAGDSAPFRFASQALIASWDLMCRYPASSTEPVPIVLLIVDEWGESGFEVARVERRAMETVADDLPEGVHARPCFTNILGSVSYSTRALRNAANLVFESEI
ncbi:hypothetical protein MPH_11661 [Macrophomina phaseolina MS6]|uniref:Uncharacterized protein n=1 Tax=Macrophomina phaseolina (strain MS6) TaxID=1126212 RepID=K2S389_MACPH|nr:hypothetical protein MPH_11661 [Macrophomina phaseolina MS6]